MKGQYKNGMESAQRNPSRQCQPAEGLSRGREDERPTGLRQTYTMRRRARRKVSPAFGDARRSLGWRRLLDHLLSYPDDSLASRQMIRGKYDGVLHETSVWCCVVYCDCNVSMSNRLIRTMSVYHPITAISKLLF
jgi:hypothetical protein